MNETTNHSDNDAPSRNDGMRGRSSEEPLVSAYAFGELSEAEEQAFEAELLAGSPEAKELDEMLDGMTALAEHIGSGAAAPRKSIKNAMMLSAIASIGEERDHLGKGHRVVRNDNAGWAQEPDFPGFSVKVLYKDESTGMFTLLAKLEPGAVYPSHRHRGTEQCYVVSGTFQENEILLQAGDYIVAHDGTMHKNVFSPDGCLLLLNTMMEDEHFA